MEKDKYAEYDPSEEDDHEEIEGHLDAAEYIKELAEINELVSAGIVPQNIVGGFTNMFEQLITYITKEDENIK